mgnify:CR=1 FL=1
MRKPQTGIEAEFPGSATLHLGGADLRHPGPQRRWGLFPRSALSLPHERKKPPSPGGSLSRPSQTGNQGDRHTTPSKDRVATETANSQPQRILKAALRAALYKDVAGLSTTLSTASKCFTAKTVSGFSHTPFLHFPRVIPLSSRSCATDSRSKRYSKGQTKT